MLKLCNINAFNGIIQAHYEAGISIDQGEIGTLSGANGAGKSTTLMTIIGLRRSGVAAWSMKDAPPFPT